MSKPPDKRTRAGRESLEELRLLEQEELRLTRELALKDMWFFMTTVLWPVESPLHFEEKFHRPICDRITEAPPGTRDLLLSPRMSRKTMVRTVCHSVWRLCRDPNVRILIVSALDATASDMVETIKRQLQHNDSLRRFFPEVCPPPGKFGTTYEFTLPSRTAINLIDPSVRATYLGAPFVGRRCDIALLDDIIDDKHVSTPEQADKALKWVNAIEPLVDRNPIYNMVFVQGTRKAFNDAYGAFLGESRGEEAQVGHEGGTYSATVIAALQDEQGRPSIDGEPVFPKILHRQELMRLLEQSRMNSNEGEAFWWREFMNVIGDPTSRKFLPEWLQTWVPCLPSNVVWSGIAIDSALKDKQIAMGRGDFTVMLVGHFDVYGHLYLTDGARSNSWRWAEFSRELVGMAQRSQVFNVLKEKVSEALVFGAIEADFHRQRLPITTYPLQVQQEGKKVVRIIEALQGPTQGRKIHFVQGFPEALHRVISDELTHLGQWSHDDAADALSLFFHRDVRIIPSTGRSVPWTPLNNRLLQGSTPSHNPAAVWASAVRSRPQDSGGGDGSLRPDPFLQDIIDGMGGDGNMGSERRQFLPYPFGVERSRG